jgi:hypothetical protein
MCHIETRENLMIKLKFPKKSENFLKMTGRHIPNNDFSIFSNVKRRKAFTQI